MQTNRPNKYFLGFLTFAFLAIGFTASAAYEDSVSIKGVLVKFDKDFAWLKAEKSTTKVRRENLPNLAGYLVGTAEVQAEISLVDLKKLNPEFFKQ